MGNRLPTNRLTLPTYNQRDAINQILDRQFAAAASHRIDIILVVLPNADHWLYSRIKFYGDVKHGVHTNCCVGSKLVKLTPSYLGNIALKFNAKGGGISHRQAEQELYPVDHRTMVVGIDVTHPSPASAEGSPSIAGVVANVDKSLVQWPGSLRVQTGRQEMVAGLTEMLIERIDLWQKRNSNARPNKMIICRDGVSEGQYRQVLDTELPAIQAAFKPKFGAQSNWPKLMIIVCGKRHHARFYPTNVNDSDGRSGNPKPGTVVDRGITDNFLWDFYLQAHQGLQGTARPCHYVVICRHYGRDFMDEIGVDQDKIEKMTHAMCYLFPRATKAVSYCPAAYNADLICERGREYMYSTLNENRQTATAVYNATNAEFNGNVHPRLKDTMFYL